MVEGNMLTCGFWCGVQIGAVLIGASSSQAGKSSANQLR